MTDPTNGTLETLTQQVAELYGRVRALEAQIARLSAAPGPVSPPIAPSLQQAPPAAPRPPTALPAFLRTAQPQISNETSSSTTEERIPEDARTLENRIGSQLFNRIGIIALFAGVAWFFKFAVDNGWLGPAMRVILGLVAGSSVVLWSERFRQRNYAVFSYTLKAVGTGVLYLTIWSAYSLYHFIPSGVAFAGMVLITLLNGWFALLENSELLAFYALSGAFATPLLLTTHADHEIFLFSYLLLLNVASFILAVKKQWLRLIAAAYPSTVLFAIGWYSVHYDASKLAVTLFFATCFWLLYGIAPAFLRRLAPADANSLGAQNILTDAVLPIAHAAISYSFICVLWWSEQSHLARANESAWTALVFSVFYVALALAARKDEGASTADSGLRISGLRTPAVNATLAVAFCTLFVPLYFDGRDIIYAWLVEGLLLVFTSLRLAIPHGWALAVAPLFLASSDLLLSGTNSNHPETTVVFNARFACFLAGIATMAVVAFLSRTRSDSRPFANSVLVVLNLLALVAVGHEIATYWRDSPTLFAERFSYSIWFMIYGAGLLVVGFWRRSALSRWQGLALLAVTIAKVFAYDMASLSQGYRVLSLLGLGALLLTVSFAYQRDWLRLRESR